MLYTQTKYWTEYTCRSVRPSVRLSVRPLSVRPSARSSARPSVRPSVRPSDCLSSYRGNYLPICCLLVCLPACLFVCLSIIDLYVGQRRSLKWFIQSVIYVEQNITIRIDTIILPFCIYTPDELYYLHISGLGSAAVRSLAAGAKGLGFYSPVHPALSDNYFSGLYVQRSWFTCIELGLCPSMWVHFLFVYLD